MHLKRKATSCESRHAQICSAQAHGSAYLRSKAPTQRWHGLNGPNSFCEDQFLDCRRCNAACMRGLVATPKLATWGCTADGVILQGAVGKEYATGRALASRLNNSEWDVTAQQAVEVFSCARIWFVGENIFRSLFFATTNLLNEPFSEGAYMTPRSMYFKWSYTSISVFKQKAKR
jgi:hypothetical protein